MKKNCIVILISDQTIPNLMFLKWFLSKNNGEPLDLFCITTVSMEKKGKIKAIQNALGERISYFSDIIPIIVDENDLEQITEKLKVYFSDSGFYNEVYVNITGGTKLMSIACFIFFNNKNNSVLYYQPVREPLQVLYPKKSEDKAIEIPISIKEYFATYNVTYEPNNFCVKDWEFNRNVFPIIEDINNERLSFLDLQNVDYFKKRLKKKGFLEFDTIDAERLSRLSHVSTAEQLRAASVKLGFGSDVIYGKEIRYITGGWFEEFVYQKLKSEKNLDDDYIALNVVVKKVESEKQQDNGSSVSDTKKVSSSSMDKNELDIVYIEGKVNPTLHIVECKSFIDESSQAKLLTDTLYKMQALKKDFGLTVKSHLYTMSVIQKESALSRAEDLDIEIVDRTKLLP